MGMQTRETGKLSSPNANEDDKSRRMLGTQTGHSSLERKVRTKVHLKTDL